MKVPQVILHNSRFQALNDKERADWLETITTAILAGLVGGEKAPAPPTKKETTVQVCGKERERKREKNEGREEGEGEGGEGEREKESEGGGGREKGILVAV